LGGGGRRYSANRGGETHEVDQKKEDRAGQEIVVPSAARIAHSFAFKEAITWHKKASAQGSFARSRIRVRNGVQNHSELLCKLSRSLWGKRVPETDKGLPLKEENGREGHGVSGARVQAGRISRTAIHHGEREHSEGETRLIGTCRGKARGCNASDRGRKGHVRQMTRDH